MDEIKLPVSPVHTYNIIDADNVLICTCAWKGNVPLVVAALNADALEIIDCPPSGGLVKDLRLITASAFILAHKAAAVYEKAQDCQARIVELEKEREEYLKDLLLCPCGWIGDVDDQDSGNTECGCCPHCGNENLVFASKAIKRIVELEKEIIQLKTQQIGGSENDSIIEEATRKAALGEEGKDG